MAWYEITVIISAILIICGLCKIASKPVKKEPLTGVHKFMQAEIKPFPEPEIKNIYWLEKNGFAFRCYLSKIVKNEAGKSMYLFREFNGIYHLRENLNRVFTAYDETEISPDISQLSKQQLEEIEKFVNKFNPEKPLFTKSDLERFGEKLNNKQ